MQSIHYRAAQRAFQQGQTAREFEEAAQRHEKVFWVSVLAAVLLWWSVGWHWAALAMAIAVWSAYRSFADKRIQSHIARCKHPVPERLMEDARVSEQAGRNERVTH